MIYTVIVSDGYVSLEQDHESLYQAMRHKDDLIGSGFNVEVECYEVREKRTGLVPLFSLVYNPT